MGRSRGGLTSKIHALVDTNVLADRGHDADWIRELARKKGAWANTPPNYESTS